MAKTSLPNAWAKLGDVEVLTGLDITDKANLVGVPFCITSVRFYTGAQQVEYVEVKAIDETGKTIAFTDSSSTGIRQKLVEIVTGKGAAGVIDTGDDFPLLLAVYNGLRVSIYDVTRMGKVEKNAGRTFYLAVSDEE